MARSFSRVRWNLGAVGRMLAVLVVTCTTFYAQSASAHVGRRFDIRVVDGKIVAQGVNNGDPDGAPDERPYSNVIHDHWKNSPLAGANTALAILPEFDISSPAPELQFRPLELTLVHASKWVNPPMMTAAGLIPTFEDLATDELISITVDAQTIDSESLGSLFLSSSVPSAGVTDIPINYGINATPANEIHLLEFVLSSPNSSLLASDPVFILLSPDGANPMEKLHHASLYAEQYIGTRSVPEPTTIACTFGLLLLLTGSRRVQRPFPA